MSLEVTFGTPGTGPAPPPSGLAGPIGAGPPASDLATLFAALLANVAPVPPGTGKPAVLAPTEEPAASEPGHSPDPNDDPSPPAAPDVALTTILMAMAVPPPAVPLSDPPLAPKASETKGVGEAPEMTPRLTISTPQTTNTAPPQTTSTTPEAMDTLPTPVPSAPSAKADTSGGELLPRSSNPTAIQAAPAPFAASAPTVAQAAPTAIQAAPMPALASAPASPAAPTMAVPTQTPVFDGAVPVPQAPVHVSPRPITQPLIFVLDRTSMASPVAVAPASAPVRPGAPVTVQLNDARPKMVSTSAVAPIAPVQAAPLADPRLPEIIPQAKVDAKPADVVPDATPQPVAPPEPVIVLQPAAQPEPSAAPVTAPAQPTPTLVPAGAPKVDPPQAVVQAASVPTPLTAQPTAPVLVAIPIQAALQNGAAPANNTGTPTPRVDETSSRPVVAVRVTEQVTANDGPVAFIPERPRPTVAVREEVPQDQTPVNRPATKRDENAEQPSAFQSGAEAPPIAPAAPFAPTTSAPAVPQTATTLTSADRAQVMRQVSEGAREMRLRPAAGGAHEMNLQLHPHDWGQITLSVRMTPETGPDGTAGTTVVAHIVADNPVVKAALETHTGELRHALHEAGLRLDRLSVTVQAPAEGRQPDMRGQGEQRFGQDTGAWAGQMPTQTSTETSAPGQTGNSSGFGGAFSSAFGDSRGGSQADTRPYPQTPVWTEDAGEAGPTRTHVASRPQSGRWDSRA